MSSEAPPRPTTDDVLDLLTRRASRHWGRDVARPGVTISFLVDGCVYASLARHRATRDGTTGRHVVLNHVNRSVEAAVVGLAERALLMCFTHDDCRECTRRGTDDMAVGCLDARGGDRALRAFDDEYRREMDSMNLSANGAFRNYGVLTEFAPPPVDADAAMRAFAQEHRRRRR